MATIVKGATLKLDLDVTADTVAVTIAGPDKVTVNAVLTDGVFRVRYDTSGMQVGLYAVEAIATLNGEKTVLPRSTFLLEESLAGSEAGNYDASSDVSSAQTMVDMIRAMLKGKASSGVQSYQINNRRLDSYSIDELLKLLNYFERELAVEKRKAAGKSILGPRIEFRI